MRLALQLIGPRCHNCVPGFSCRTDPSRTPDARYAADRWCDGCLASYGLDADPSKPAAPAPEFKLAWDGTRWAYWPVTHLMQQREPASCAT